MSEITISKAELRQLKKLYAKAVECDVDIFIFKGAKIATGYAKYIIEYLDGMFEGVK